jgi:rubrerythrin
MDINKVFAYALQREYEGKRFFDENAERLSHAAAISAFKALSGEEAKHIIFIQNLIKSLEKGEFLDYKEGEEFEKAGFFTQRAKSEFLDQTIVEAMVPDLPVLRTAYLIEHDFTEFYARSAESAEGEAKLALEMLSRWEHGHELFFKQLHDKAFEAYSQMPWGG